MGQPCGATGEPGTCKWCGRKLRQQFYTKYEHVQRTKSLCCKAEITEDEFGTTVCGKCSKYTSRFKKRLVSSKKRFDKPGSYGDGHFCGLNCGYLFGVVLADSGREVRPTKKQKNG